MWIGIGYCVAILVGVAAALLMARRGEAHDDPLPWSVPDIARMQASLMSALGGVSITGVVLILSFATSRAAQAGTVELNTVAIMFGIAFGYFLQTFFALSYLPDRERTGERVFRLYFGMASTLEWRTVVLLVVALSFFVEFYGLTTTTAAMNVFIPSATLTVFLVMAVIGESLGLVRFHECWLTLLVALALGAAYWAAAQWLGLSDPYGPMAMTLVYGVINGLSYVVTGLGPLTPRRPKLKAFFEKHARKIAVIDMQVSAVSIVFLWMAVSGAV